MLTSQTVWFATKRFMDSTSNAEIVGKLAKSWRKPRACFLHQVVAVKHGRKYDKPGLTESEQNEFDPDCGCG